MDSLNITLIGLGNMGNAIGEKLLEDNFNLTVYNRSLGKEKPLVEKGAKSADSIVNACKDADIVITALFDDNAVIEVTKEVVKVLKSRAIHIGTSTILPDTAKKLTSLHDTNGSIYIGAAVLGVPNTLRAKSGTTLAAGTDDILKLCEPIFKTYSARIINVGEAPYKSNVMKICSNYLLATTIECIGGLYAFAEKSGLESEYVQGLLHSVFAHKSFTLYADKIKEQDFDQVNFSLDGGLKDLSLFEKAFNDVGVVPDLISLIKDKFIAAKANGLHEKDWSAFTEITRILAGINVK